jgi:hypothetical protein
VLFLACGILLWGEMKYNALDIGDGKVLEIADLILERRWRLRKIQTPEQKPVFLPMAF